MLNALSAQRKIHEELGGKYFFCSPSGCQVDLSNFQKMWMEVLKQAGVRYRSARQTRHTFATLPISRGENLMWIARVMDHKNTLMLHQHYLRFIENASGTLNGSKLDDLLEVPGKDG